MARPQDFEPQRQFIADDEVEARTLQKKRSNFGPPSLENSYGVQAALAQGNLAAVQKFAEIQDNKNNANDFLKRERLNRERDVKI